MEKYEQENNDVAAEVNQPNTNKNLVIILVAIVFLLLLLASFYLGTKYSSVPENIVNQKTSDNAPEAESFNTQQESPSVAEQDTSTLQRAEQKAAFTSATLTANPTNGDAPLVVSFDGQINVPYNQGGSAVMFFGDGVSDVMFRSGPELFNENWSHTYKEPGTYEAMLVLSSEQNVDADIEVMKDPNYIKNTIVKKVTIVVTEN